MGSAFYTGMANLDITIPTNPNLVVPTNQVGSEFYTAMANLDVTIPTGPNLVWCTRWAPQRSELTVRLVHVLAGGDLFCYIIDLLDQFIENLYQSGPC